MQDVGCMCITCLRYTTGDDGRGDGELRGSRLPQHVLLPDPDLRDVPRRDTAHQASEAGKCDEAVDVLVAVLINCMRHECGFFAFFLV